jgi:UDPglucose--hexose-1-phosphate uridylyltransferase
MSIAKLPAGITRTDRYMADGRTIRYYDTKGQGREAQDQRPAEAQPQIGELRYDALVGEWVAVASHRQNRIFLPPKELCPLCPTSENPGELLTEIPESDFEVVVFDNRGPSFRPPTGDFELPDALSTLTAEGQTAGKCEVICFAADHGKSLKDLTPSQVRIILEAWKDRVRELSQASYIAHIAPFENRGEEVGVTLSHPHGQIYSYPFLPPRVEKMLAAAQEHKDRTGRVLLDDVVAREIKDGDRIIARNEQWIAYVPYAARYPFEIHVAPINPVADLAELDDAASAAFPEIALEVLNRLDGVFGIEMAYIAAWHQAPVRVGRDLMRLHWQITSVRRQPGKLKYLAGSESAMGAFIMDLKPEQSATQLREVKL